MRNLNKYDFILKMFVGSDDLRPQLQSPALVGDSIFSTDAICLIKISKDLPNGDYSDNEKFPQSCDNLILEAKRDLSEIETIKTEDLMLRMFNLNPSFDVLYEECEDCEGAGIYECKCCENEVDCKNCDGDGDVEKDNPFSRIVLLGKDLLFYKTKYAPKFIYRVVEVALILGEKKITVQYNEEKRKLLFTIGSVEVLIMGKTA